MGDARVIEENRFASIHEVWEKLEVQDPKDYVDRVAETLTYHYTHGGWAPIEAEEREREIFDPSRFDFSPPGWFYTKIGSTLPPITKPTSPEMDRPRHIWKIVRIPFQRDRNMIRQWAREINESHGIPPRSERSWMDVPKELMDEAIRDLEQQLNLEAKFVDGWFYRWLLREARKPTTMEGRGSKTSKATQRPAASALEGTRPAASAPEGTRLAASAPEGTWPAASAPEGIRPTATATEGTQSAETSEVPDYTRIPISHLVHKE